MPERKRAVPLAVCGRAQAGPMQALSREESSDAVCIPVKEAGHRFRLKP